VLVVSEFLLFTLHAPLASWGEIAVGEARGSWDRPSRSAVLGLMAAALGIRREAQVEHDALDAAYCVAVRLDAPGTPMVDYHTAQTVGASVVKRVRLPTRARLLAAGDPDTILSRRAYRQDALATSAVWLRLQPSLREGAGRAPTLEALRDALMRPVFTLYAGRKANSLGLPLAPEIIEVATLADALRNRAQTRGMRSDAPGAARSAVDGVWEALRPRAGWGREVAHDHCDGMETGLNALRREVRRDTSPHRGRWHFAERNVEVGWLPETQLPEGSP
jgi:CRISPR system Cascade subunit CasD